MIQISTGYLSLIVFACVFGCAVFGAAVATVWPLLGQSNDEPTYDRFLSFDTTTANEERRARARSAIPKMIN